MRRCTSFVGIVPVVVVLLVVMALPAGAKKDTPFNATMWGNDVEFDFDFALDGAAVAARCPEMIEADLVVQSLTTFVGIGNGTHLGRFVATAQHCSNVDTGLYMDGRLTIEAANGDELVGTYTNGYSVPDAIPPTEVAFFDEFSFTDGGTGRFTFASGGGAETGTFNFGTGDFTVEMTGRIAYSRK
ncbi:MAG: hypothetical protein HKO82_04230 [Acidimicrobiia bacterium]|nr:hypothetical protein [Acidimicrobiia bacterium]